MVFADSIRDSLWITGPARSGKTARLVQQCRLLAGLETQDDQFLEVHSSTNQPCGSRHLKPALVFAPTGNARLELNDRIAEATRGHFAYETASPLGFFESEITLFYPLLVEKLGLKSHYPVRLRPETEQELATQLWKPDLEEGKLVLQGVTEYFVVRRMLDLLQLAASGETPCEEIASMLQVGFEAEGAPEVWQAMGDALLRWRDWCLERGILSYGILTELYWRHLLPHPTYQHHLQQRYSTVIADDVDDYPAIAHSLFSLLLDQGVPGLFTYNPTGATRLGLGSDPHYLATLADRCTVEELEPPENSLGALWGDDLAQWVKEPTYTIDLPDSLHSIQTLSRAQLLRQTAEQVADAIYSGQVKPQEVAIIGPGVDAIARYTFREILGNKGIPVTSLNDQQPLASSPLIRALLTLMALVYPGLGRLLSRDAIAELLVILSQAPMELGGTIDDPFLQPNFDQSPAITGTVPPPLTMQIDPVRAGLIIDHCFVPDPDRPHLLPTTAFPRWDRLGYQAAQAYEGIRQWIETQQQQQQQRLIPTPVTLLDRAIQRFLYGGSHLSYDQFAAIRELMETAQHYWEVEARLRQVELAETDEHLQPGGASGGMGAVRSSEVSAVGHFIQLLRNGTITADPYPVRPFPGRHAVTLATIFQYRANHCAHRWQFWLDAGSALWLTGGSYLFGAPLLLKEWNGRPWSAADALSADQQRLERQILDLLYRTHERVYLCHSELATSGQEQTGPLVSLVNVTDSDLVTLQEQKCNKPGI